MSINAPFNLLCNRSTAMLCIMCSFLMYLCYFVFFSCCFDVVVFDLCVSDTVSITPGQHLLMEISQYIKVSCSLRVCVGFSWGWSDTLTADVYLSMNGYFVFTCDPVKDWFTVQGVPHPHPLTAGIGSSSSHIQAKEDAVNNEWIYVIMTEEQVD